MKRLAMVFFIFGLVLLSSCTQQAQPIATSSDNIVADDPNMQGLSGSEVVQDKSSSVKTIEMTAEQWKWTPNTITVNEGDTVVIHITSKDVTHGFHLPAFNIDEQIVPGKTITVQFVADKKGTFPWACSVFCGAGHVGMTGALVVN